MKKAFKIASLFVGTIIGAGFASGREIALFFGNMSPLFVAFSGIILGLFAFLFMLAGKRGFKLESSFIAVMVYICSIITAAAMIAASEDILHSMTHLNFLGFASGALGVFIVVKGIEKIKILNVVAVPMIIVLIAVLFFKSGDFSVSGNFGILRPFAYAGLNIFLAGIIITKEGEKSSGKEILLASLMSGVFLAVTLFCIQCIIKGNIDSAMPMLDAANRLNLPIFCDILVFVAVFTTFVSSAQLMFVLTKVFIEKNKFLSRQNISGAAIPALFTLLLSYLFSLLGFKNIVDWFYPVISVCGIICLAIVLFTFLKTQRSNRILLLFLKKKNKIQAKN